MLAVVEVVVVCIYMWWNLVPTRQTKYSSASSVSGVIFFFPMEPGSVIPVVGVMGMAMRPSPAVSGSVVGIGVIFIAAENMPSPASKALGAIRWPCFVFMSCTASPRFESQRLVELFG